MPKSFRISTDYSYGDVFIKLGRYRDMSPAMLIVDAHTGQPLIKATVCLSVKPEEGNVFIKDWSENSGIYEALRISGIISEIIRKVPTGFQEAYECKLLIPVDDERVVLM